MIGLLRWVVIGIIVVPASVFGFVLAMGVASEFGPTACHETFYSRYDNRCEDGRNGYTKNAGPWAVGFTMFVMAPFLLLWFKLPFDGFFRDVLRRSARRRRLMFGWLECTEMYSNFDVPVTSSQEHGERKTGGNVQVDG